MSILQKHDDSLSFLILHGYILYIFRDTRLEVGHHIEDMLISCSYDGYECYAE